MIKTDIELDEIPTTLWNKSMQNNNNKTKQKAQKQKQNKNKKQSQKKKNNFIMVLTQWYTGGLSVLEVKNIMIASITHTGKNSCHR